MNKLSSHRLVLIFQHPMRALVTRVTFKLWSHNVLFQRQEISLLCYASVTLFSLINWRLLDFGFTQQMMTWLSLLSCAADCLTFLCLLNFSLFYSVEFGEENWVASTITAQSRIQFKYTTCITILDTSLPSLSFFLSFHAHCYSSPLLQNLNGFRCQ